MTFKHEPRHPETIWLVVADRAHARIFTADSLTLEHLREIKALVHPEAQAHSRDVMTDRPGRFAGGGGACAAGDPETDFQHQTAADFACQLVAELEQGRTHQKFGKLVLVAPALFLGTLRQHLPRPLKKLVSTEIDKEFTQLTEGEIGERVRRELTVDAVPLD